MFMHTQLASSQAQRVTTGARTCSIVHSTQLDGLYYILISVMYFEVTVTCHCTCCVNNVS